MMKLLPSLDMRFPDTFHLKYLSVCTFDWEGARVSDKADFELILGSPATEANGK